MLQVIFTVMSRHIYTHKHAHTHNFKITQNKEVLPKYLRLSILFWEPSIKRSRLKGEQSVIIWNLSIHWIRTWIWRPIIL